MSKYLGKHLDERFTFHEHPEVAPTNREGERAIRPAVVKRKGWWGNRTRAGACARGVLMSVLQTYKRIGRPGLDFNNQTQHTFGNPPFPRPILLPR